MTYISAKTFSVPYLKDPHKLKVLTNFDVNLTSFLEGVINYALNIQLIALSGVNVRLT